MRRTQVLSRGVVRRVISGRGTQSVIAAAAALCAPQVSLATNWINPGSGDWFTPTNWSLGAVPTATDDVRIDIGGTAILSGTLPNASGATVTLGTISSSSGTLSLSAGTLATSVGGDIRIGGAGGGGGVGALFQSGGIANLGANVNIGFGGNALGFYSISAGTLTAATLSTGAITTKVIAVGNSGSGFITQSGGLVNSAGELDLGRAATGGGFYTMTGGGLTTVGDIWVGGRDGTATGGFGVFNQSGGNVTAAGILALGRGNGSTGFYTLSGGTVSANEVDDGGTVGSAGGAGVFVQTGGTLSAVTFNLTLGANGIGTHSGSYTMYGGLLKAGTAASNVMAIGNANGVPATFTQNGGVVQAFGVLDIGRATGSNATYVMNGGTLITGLGNATLADLVVGGSSGGVGGNGSLIQNGGTVTLTSQNLNIALNGSTGLRAVGSYTLNGGTLAAHTGAIIAVGNGLSTTATFTQNGGVVNFPGASTLSVGRASANGTYNFNNGLLQIATISTNGATTSTHAFNFNGGTLAATSIQLPVTNVAGTLSPGLAGTVGATTVTIGTSNTNATYVQNSGATLAIDLASATSFDSLNVTATSGTQSASLNGALTVNTIGGYTPNVGDTFNVVNSQTITDNGIVVVDQSPAAVSFTKAVTAGGAGQVLQLTAVAASQWNATGTNWDNAGSWSTGVVPSGVGVKAHLGSAGAQTAVNVGAETLGTLNFDSATSYALGGGSITLQAPAGNAAINVVTGSHSIASPINLASTAIMNTIDPAGTLTLSGAMSGSGGIYKTGAGTLLLSNTHTYSGGTTVAAGTLQTSGNAPFEIDNTGPLVVSAGATLIDNAPIRTGALSGGGSIVTNANLFVGEDNGSSTFDGSITGSAGSLIKDGTGTLTLSQAPTITRAANTATITVAAGTLKIAAANYATDLRVHTGGALELSPTVDATFTGALEGNGVLVKSGPYSLYVSPYTTNFNGHSGGTVVNGGTLVLATQLPVSFSNTVGSATLDFATPMSIANNRVFSLGGSATFGGTFGQSATLAGAISGTGSLTKAGLGALTLSGNNTYSGGTTIAAGSMVLAGSTALPSASALTMFAGTTLTVKTISPFIGSLNGAGSIVLATVAGPATLNVGSDNSNSMFGGSISGFGALNKSGTGVLTLGGVDSYNGGTTVAAGTLQGSTSNVYGPLVDNAAVIVNQNFDGSVAGNISGTGSVTKLGTGTVTFGGTNSWTGGTNISGGVVVTTNSASLGDAASVITMSNGAVLTPNVSHTLPQSIVFLPTNGNITVGTDSIGNPLTLTVAGSLSGAGGLTKNGTGVLAIPGFTNGGIKINAGSIVLAQNGNVVSQTLSLTVGDNTAATTAKLDLNDNDLILGYTAASPAGTIRTLLTAGFNAGGWDGNGIASAAAHVNAAQTTALGYEDASDLGVSSFDGVTLAVGSSAVLVKYTYYGDSDLNGAVDMSDFQRYLDGLAGGGSTWVQGDYTYDGTVDIGNDFNLFLTGYMLQGGALGDLAGAIEGSNLSAVQKANLLSAVPEPSSIAGLALVSAAIVGRRRRRAV